MQQLAFPQYRKYLNGSSYFRFESMDFFEELRSIGAKWMIEKHEVKILPDRNLVHDLLYNYHEFAVEVDAEEYAEQREKAKN